MAAGVKEQTVVNRNRLGKIGLNPVSKSGQALAGGGEGFLHRVEAGLGKVTLWGELFSEVEGEIYAVYTRARAHTH